MPVTPFNNLRVENYLFRLGPQLRVPVFSPYNLCFFFKKKNYFHYLTLYLSKIKFYSLFYYEVILVLYHKP